ncbi:MAG: carboxypeptidase-like regulatory domain-containing protein, partial [Muribaculaceae bacterium]|nr:carboxypeptidase-like regulatory domain-containing protein [Muribaculaceae bacterium]
MDKAIGNAEIRRWILGMILSILLIPVSAYAQTQRTVTGTVLDETGEPLIGATVKVEGTTLGTSTDFDGHFSLNIPESAKQLTFS